MAWTKLIKPAFIVGKFLRGVFDGARDEIVETFTDAEITRFADTAEMLKDCKPWENHLKRDAYEPINQALKKKDYINARMAVDTNARETANPHCITLLKMVLVEERWFW